MSTKCQPLRSVRSRAPAEDPFCYLRATAFHPLTVVSRVSRLRMRPQSNMRQEVADIKRARGLTLLFCSVALVGMTGCGGGGGGADAAAATTPGDPSSAASITPAPAPVANGVAAPAPIPAADIAVVGAAA